MPKPNGSRTRKKVSAETSPDKVIAAKEETAPEIDSLAIEIDAATAELK